LLGLSGTGKTTLSADRAGALLGDDEHAWSNDGIANFENGCYAKLIDLDAKKEPEIHQAVFHPAPPEKHGAIVENAMIYPDGTFDLFDDRLTPNSRGSYPLEFLSNVKASSAAGTRRRSSSSPRTPTASSSDRASVEGTGHAVVPHGVHEQTRGTETGIVEPKTTFSRFFGEPFMPRNPDVYARMLGEKLDEHGTEVYLVNTGWSGGPYGQAKRMDITLTRTMVHAALSGELHDVSTR